MPGEVYSFGTIFLLGALSQPVGILIASQLILPVFFNLKVVSVYKVSVAITDGTQALFFCKFYLKETKSISSLDE